MEVVKFSYDGEQILVSFNPDGDNGLRFFIVNTDDASPIYRYRILIGSNQQQCRVFTDSIIFDDNKYILGVHTV